MTRQISRTVETFHERETISLLNFESLQFGKRVPECTNIHHPSPKLGFVRLVFDANIEDGYEMTEECFAPR